MMGPAPHTQLDAELAAGMGKPDNGPKLMSWELFGLQFLWELHSFIKKSPSLYSLYLPSIQIFFPSVIECNSSQWCTLSTWSLHILC